MLDPDQVDLDELCFARDDHTVGVSWWIAPGTGEIRPHTVDDADHPEDLVEGGWIAIPSVESHEGYRDLADFVETVQHPRAADLLNRAIAGRGAFRRFKNTLHEFPEIRDQWFRFRDARSRRRALRWLGDVGLISPEAAEAACALHPDPATTDADVPGAVAADLAALYGERLRQVLVFGPATRDFEDSGVDLLVVLTDMTSPWDELRRMDDVLWRHTERSGLAILALPVTRAEFGRPTTPAVTRAKAQAVRVG
jgi:hypothetical protein